MHVLLPRLSPGALVGSACVDVLPVTSLQVPSTVVLAGAAGPTAAGAAAPNTAVASGTVTVSNTLSARLPSWSTDAAATARHAIQQASWGLWWKDTAVMPAQADTVITLVMTVCSLRHPCSAAAAAAAAGTRTSNATPKS